MGTRCLIALGLCGLIGCYGDIRAGLQEEANALADCQRACADELIVCWADIEPDAPDALDAIRVCATELEYCKADCFDEVGE